MTPPVPAPTPLWPLAAYLVAVLILTAGMIGASYVLGQRRMGRATGEPFECGVLPVGSARQRWDVRFYLIAVLFILFDIEVIFFLPWAVILREFVAENQGVFAFIEMTVFILILLVGYIYAWKKGALEWE